MGFNWHIHCSLHCIQGPDLQEVVVDVTVCLPQLVLRQAQAKFAWRDDLVMEPRKLRDAWGQRGRGGLSQHAVRKMQTRSICSFFKYNKPKRWKRAYGLLYGDQSPPVNRRNNASRMWSQMPYRPFEESIASQILSSSSSSQPLYILPTAGQRPSFNIGNKIMNDT